MVDLPAEDAFLYARRRERLTTACEEEGYGERHRLQRFRRVIVWHEESMSAYCPVEKVASSTLVESLNRMGAER